MEITITGIDAHLDRVSKYVHADEKCNKVAERLCKEVGEPIVRATHGGHSPLTSEENGKMNGWSVVLTVKGTDAMFIEFGAGDAAGRDNGKYDKAPAVARPGSWSERHDGQYAKTKRETGQGYWIFGGQMYTERPPHPSLYYAYEAMVQRLKSVFDEVFK